MLTQTCRRLALPVMLLLVLPAVVHAQFTFTTNNGAITITGYTGSGGSVVIPDTTNGYPVTTIGNDAFDNNFSVNSVTIGTNITTIGNYAFYACYYLTNVTIGSSVSTIGTYAFSENIRLISIRVDTSNLAFSSINGILFDKSIKSLIQYPGGLVGSYTIPSSVTSIQDGAFAGCGSLNGISIPNSVSYIGGWAFSDCSSLTNILLPKSVTNIGLLAFLGCTSLTSINVAAQDSAYSSLGGVLFNQSQTTLVEYPPGLIGSYVIPNGVTSIASLACYGCSSLTSIAIPDSVTSIGGQAFAFCNLTSVSIPNSVIGIGSYAFEVCDKLTNVLVGSSVTSIGDGAFWGCPILSGIDFRGNAPNLGGTNVFSGDSNTIAFYLLGTTGWSSTFGGIPTAFWNTLPVISIRPTN